MRINRYGMALVLLTTAWACKQQGIGKGELEPAAETEGGEQEGGEQSTELVEFVWQSARGDYTNGKIGARLPDGRAFKGTYLQLTDTVEATALRPYWYPWASSYWGAPGPWLSGSATYTTFVTEYGGQVIAHLKDQRGTRMRCHFLLKDPVSGLAGRGEGDCQLSTGESVFHAVLKKGKPAKG